VALSQRHAQTSGTEHKERGGSRSLVLASQAVSGPAGRDRSLCAMLLSRSASLTSVPTSVPTSVATTDRDHSEREGERDLAIP